MCLSKPLLLFAIQSSGFSGSHYHSIFLSIVSLFACHQMNPHDSHHRENSVTTSSTNPILPASLLRYQCLLVGQQQNHLLSVSLLQPMSHPTRSLVSSGPVRFD